MREAQAGMDRSRGSAGDIADLSRGTNQAGLRLYNERLVLSLIRRNGSLSKADIARLTGLSPQTISTIANGLERGGLLTRQAPQRGRVGQPSTPYALAPDGALAFGLKIGRRSMDLVVMDLLGQVRGKIHRPYPYPVPGQILEFLREGIAALSARLTAEQRARVAGLGIASPFELWNWGHQLGAPEAVLAAWQATDIKAEVERLSPWPVHFYNDATAACAAELLLGNPGQHLDFLYIFIGTFIGGGVVLNGSLFPGRSGYAGAIGPMPVLRRDGKGYEQVLRRSSLYTLTQTMHEAGLDPEMLLREDGDWQAIGPILENWLEMLCEGLAVIILSATAIIDFEAIIIDGGFPASLRQTIISRVEHALETFDRQGLKAPAIVAGQLGPDARAMGGACLPLISNFTLDREVLFKEV